MLLTSHEDREVCAASLPNPAVSHLVSGVLPNSGQQSHTHSSGTTQSWPYKAHMHATGDEVSDKVRNAQKFKA